MKKYRRVLAAVLAVLVLLPVLAGCQSNDASDNKEQETPINPDLVAAFGEDLINEEKETIEELVNALEDCYTQHQKDKDVYQFITNVENAMQPYEGYMQEIFDELMEMHEVDEGENKTELLLLHSTSVSCTIYKNTWSTYKFMIDLGDTPLHTEQEAEAAVIDYINAISEFFYAKPIVEDSQ